MHAFVEHKCLLTYFISFSFYSATIKDQKASYKSRQNTILYSAYGAFILACIHITHIYIYAYTHVIATEVLRTLFQV